MQKPSN